MDKNYIWNKYPEMMDECFDFSIVDYWIPVIDKLLSVIQYSRKRKGLPVAKVYQIKDKFGGLRIYFDKTTDLEDKWISAAEEKCRNICQLCGAKEDVTLNKIGSWLWTICSPCAKTKQELK